jgi:hypothetical protein
MATIAEDTFNRSDRSLDGDTMSDGSSTWALGNNGGWSIVSNQARSDLANGVEFCDSMSDTADIRSRIETYDASVGAFARYDNSTKNGYVSVRTGANVHRLFRSAGLSFTQLGSDGSTVSNGETIAVVCNGTSISAEYEGSTDVGPVTDSNYSTGKAAIWAASGSKDIDNFFSETLAAPPAGAAGFKAQQYYRTLLAGGAR